MEELKAKIEQKLELLNNDLASDQTILDDLKVRFSPSDPPQVQYAIMTEIKRKENRIAGTKQEIAKWEQQLTKLTGTSLPPKTSGEPTPPVPIEIPESDEELEARLAELQKEVELDNLKDSLEDEVVTPAVVSGIGEETGEPESLEPSEVSETTEVVDAEVIEDTPNSPQGPSQS